MTEYLEQEVLEELREEYGEFLKNRDLGLAAALRRLYAKTERQESEPMQKQYLDFLRNLLKDQPYVALAYMTGILPTPGLWWRQ